MPTLEIRPSSRKQTFRQRKYWYPLTNLIVNLNYKSNLCKTAVTLSVYTYVYVDWTSQDVFFCPLPIFHVLKWIKWLNCTDSVCKCTATHTSDAYGPITEFSMVADESTTILRLVLHSCTLGTQFSTKADEMLIYRNAILSQKSRDQILLFTPILLLLFPNKLLRLFCINSHPPKLILDIKKSWWNTSSSYPSPSFWIFWILAG